LRFLRLFGSSLPALVLTAGVFSPAQASAQDWQKSYPIAGKANLSIATGDAALTLRSCSECHAIKINVDWRDRHPSDFNLKEVQSGDQVTFQLEEKAQMGIHFTVRNWHSRRSPSRLRHPSTLKPRPPTAPSKSLASRAICSSVPAMARSTLKTSADRCTSPPATAPSKSTTSPVLWNHARPTVEPPSTANSADSRSTPATAVSISRSGRLSSRVVLPH